MVYGSTMLNFFLVAHLTYENQWGELRTKIQTFVFLGHPTLHPPLSFSFLLVPEPRDSVAQGAKLMFPI